MFPTQVCSPIPEPTFAETAGAASALHRFQGTKLPLNRSRLDSIRFDGFCIVRFVLGWHRGHFHRNRRGSIRALRPLIQNALTVRNITVQRGTRRPFQCTQLLQTGRPVSRNRRSSIRLQASRFPFTLYSRLGPNPSLMAHRLVAHHYAVRSVEAHHASRLDGWLNSTHWGSTPSVNVNML